MKKTTMYWPEELLAELEARSKQEGRPLSQLVREASVEYLARRPGELPAWIGTGEMKNDGVDSSNVKDWIKKSWGEDLSRRRKRRDDADA